MFKHLKFILLFPKIGPDMYFTHWLMFFKPFRIWFQKAKIGNIGKNSEVRPYCTIIGTRNIFIGRNVILPPNSLFVNLPGNNQSNIHIEDDVLFAPNVAVYSVTHTFTDISRPVKDQPVKVAETRLKKGCWIGINCVILPGITIGENSVVAANSVVTKDVPDFTLVGGTPARIIKNLKENG
jgi:acetyltransferase-like isoleucine patch superfamily enzyme